MTDPPGRRIDHDEDRELLVLVVEVVDARADLIRHSMLIGAVERNAPVAQHENATRLERIL
jgi:hypothetical protein